MNTHQVHLTARIVIACLFFSLFAVASVAIAQEPQRPPNPALPVRLLKAWSARWRTIVLSPRACRPTKT